ncbi:MAG: cysteine hydrolase [Chloroflexi bacterium]|nr:cysteine hydrolase [Chloroflexota bacterium]
MSRNLLLLSIAALIPVAGCAPVPAATPAPPSVQTVIVPQTVVVPATAASTAPVKATAPATATTPSTTTTASVSIPTIPAPVAVTLDPKTTAFLILDITSVICTPRKSCVASLPAISSLLKKARDAGVMVVYSDTPTAGSTILPQVAPQPNDPKVTGRADKFFETNLDDILKSKGIKTTVMVGSASNGAVLYTAFGANLRGYTVVAAEDGMSTDDPFAQLLTRYQLLNQPGFNNPENKPLQATRVTLSRTDLITFK